MSQIAEESLVSRLISLCKEYSKTVSEIRKEAQSLSTEWMDTAPAGSRSSMIVLAQFNALEVGFSTLEPKLLGLARAASQRIEHSQLDLGEQMELEIRLAELEASLTQTRILLDELSKVVM